jgi:hypothetical protein
MWGAETRETLARFKEATKNLTQDTLNLVRNFGRQAHAMEEVPYKGKPLRAHYEAPNWVVAINGVSYTAFTHNAGDTPETVRARLVKWADSRPDLFPG